MKALVLSAAGVILATLPAVPAAASVLTVGGPLSFSCYMAAEGQDVRSSSVDGCTRALEEENLAAPDYAATLVNRGILYALQNHFASAEADYDKAAQISPNVSEVWLNKAYLMLREDRPGEALPLLERGMSLGAHRAAVAYFARGLAHEELGDAQAAYKDFTRARELEPAWSEPVKYLAHFEVRRR